MFDFPKKNGDTFTLSEGAYKELIRDYPNLNIKHELAKMKNWLETNPRKLKQDVFRFITTWLNRAKPTPVGSMPVEASQNPALAAERRQAEQPHTREYGHSNGRRSDQAAHETFVNLRKMLRCGPMSEDRARIILEGENNS